MTTVDGLWEAIKSALEKSTTRDEELRQALSALITYKEGPQLVSRGVHQSLPDKTRLLRQLALVMEPSGPVSSNLAPQARKFLLKDAARAASGLKKEDASYWMFLWLRIKSGSDLAAEVAKELKALISEGGYRPDDAVHRLTNLRGWEDYPRDQWIELIESACKADPSPQFRSQVQPILGFLRAKGGRTPSPRSVTTPAKPLGGNPPRPPEPTHPVSGTATTAAVKPADGNLPRPPESTDPSGTRTATTEVKPVEDHRPQTVKPTIPAAATEPPESKQQRASELPVPDTVTPQPESQPPAEVVRPASETPQPLSIEVRPDPNGAKEPRPKRPTSPKKPTVKDAVAAPQSDPPSSGQPGNASDTRPAKPAGRIQPAANQQHPVADGGITTLLTEITVAVRGLSGRLDQIASRAGDESSLGRRLADLERRLIGVERVLGETQADSQRGSGETARLQARIRELEDELRGTKRQREEALARENDLAERVAAADARIKAAEERASARIEAAEKRADQNIHDAFRERDEALQTFRAKLWAAVQAQLSDVGDATPGEHFATTDEEVLTTRLRSIRDTLRAEGVAP